MRIGAIENGIVIDHITAGKGLELYHLLKLDNLDCAVAIIQNAVSKKTRALCPWSGIKRNNLSK
jgi:aspartate carbamoyltransferase regulatory subunit